MPRRHVLRRCIRPCNGTVVALDHCRFSSWSLVMLGVVKKFLLGASVVHIVSCHLFKTI